jgi:cell division protein FtsX
MMGNVKAFILSICSAVVFATLLVSANTMAMSIRERTREVAVLKTLGFTKRGVLGLFVSEAVALSLGGGILGREFRMASGLWPYAFAAVLQFLSTEGDASNLDRCAVYLCRRGLAECGAAFVSRVADQHCGWAPAHRVKS